MLLQLQLRMKQLHKGISSGQISNNGEIFVSSGTSKPVRVVGPGAGGLGGAIPGIGDAAPLLSAANDYEIAGATSF